MSFKGLKKIGEERNRTLISKLPKTKSFFSKDEKELTSKNLLKKTQEHENNPKFPINNNNNLSPTFSLKSNDLGGTNPCERKPDSNISFSNIAPCLKSNENLPNNPPSNNNINNINQNDPNRTSNTSNNSNTSRMSNCGKQLY